MKYFIHLLSSIALFAILLFISSCHSIEGVGPMVTEARNMSEIKALDLEMAANVYLIKGDTQSVVIKAQQNILDVLKTVESSGKLEIKTAESISVVDPVEIWVTVKDLEEVELSGSGSIVSTTEFNSDKISIDLSGSGKVSLVINSEKVNADLSGSGDIYLKGKCAKGKLEISGSGNIISKECVFEKCNIEINGSGNAKLFVTDELDAAIEGSGEVQYAGNPGKVKSDVSGIGKITKVD